jgi:hypothetical protein
VSASSWRSKEFAEFGPWILEVNGPDDVPRAFRDFPFDFGPENRVIKVPRDIPRRSARPDMHLYDEMACVDGKQLTVLQRSGDGYTTTSIALDAIAVIEHGTELLLGWLVITTTDGTRARMSFSGSSRATVAWFVELLHPSRSLDPLRSDPLALEALGAPDIGLVTAYLAASKRRALRVLATFRGSTLAERPSLLTRLRRAIPRLSGLVLCENSDELVLISRKEWIRSSPAPDLSIKETIVVRRHITTMTTAPLSEGVTSVKIRAGDATVDLAVPSASEATVLAAINTVRGDLVR